MRSFAVLTAATVLLGAAPAADARTPCRPAHSKTLRKTELVRVYSLPDRDASGRVAYACAYRRDRPLELGLHGNYVDDFYVHPVRIAGELVAYGEWCVCRSSGWGRVRLVDVGRRRRLLDRVSRDWFAIADLELRGDGSLAWIAQLDEPPPYPYEVWKRDPAGIARLDSGPEIAPRSLGLRDDVVSWVRAGERQRVPLAPVSPPAAGAEGAGAARPRPRLSRP